MGVAMLHENYDLFQSRSDDSNIITAATPSSNRSQLGCDIVRREAPHLIARTSQVLSFYEAYRSQGLSCKLDRSTLRQRAPWHGFLSQPQALLDTDPA